MIPNPDDLATLGTYLVPDEALVYYALTDEEAVALVVRPGHVKMTKLGSTRDIEKAVDALLRQTKRERRLVALQTLGPLLVDPLALPDAVRSVLVSPMGSLARVPFVLLLPDRDVAYVPSGTTYGLLLAEKALRGQSVLGLGAPDYGDLAPTHQRLTPLPATRGEVEAVADVKLLGVRATKSELRDAIAQRARWRAVHLACHGFVDADRPMFSSLALTPEKDSDGSLTALDIFRMEIPADLVVLSACDTAGGRVYETEGIMGLARAFMFAGAPRIVCSLWKVPDEATQELMIKFYELWNPGADRTGLRAATALRRAQEHLRTFEREVVDEKASLIAGRRVTRTVRPWSHPRYWAAWVLWGLPR